MQHFILFRAFLGELLLQTAEKYTKFTKYTKLENII